MNSRETARREPRRRAPECAAPRPRRPACRAAAVVLLALVAALALGRETRAGEPPPPVHPLKPADRSSPQATLRTFMGSSDAVAAFVADEYMASPSRRGHRELLRLGQPAIGSLDLSHVPPASRPKRGVAVMLELYEVLSRLDLTGALETGPPGPEVTTWTLPETEIRFTRNPHGEFVFSPETVTRAREFFERVRHLPYTRPVPIPHLSSLPIEAGGWMVPYAWVRALPAPLRDTVAGEAAWKWLGLAATLALAALALRAVFIFSRREGRGGPLRRAMRRLTLPLFVIVATVAVGYITLAQINLVDTAGVVTMLAASVILHAAGAWLCWRAAPVAAEVVIASPRIPDEGIDAHLIRIFARIAGIVAAAVVLALGANSLGVPLYGVVAGLGVGGLALALAAQPTIENLIGGLSLFADKPVKVGDLARCDGVVGTVEAIGIRSTRIRGADRTLTVVPNAALAKATITNLAQRDRLLIQATVSVRYETSPDQLRLLLARLREALLADARIARDPLRVRFVGFGEIGLDIEVYAYVLTADWAEFLGVREEVFLAIMAVIEQAGTGIAFPATIEYQAQDPGLNREKARAAAEEGARLRPARP